MKFGFVTCVTLGLSCIEALYERGVQLSLIITLNDSKGKNKSGRVYLDDFALLHNIPLVKVDHINSNNAQAALRQCSIDWLFIIGWSQIASQELIETPLRGCIGAHPTLLPHGRGRASIPWAIIKGLDTTGVTFFKIDSGVDTGAILLQQTIAIANDETATTLYNKTNELHKTLVSKVYDGLIAGTLKELPQDEKKATYWPGRTPADGQIFSTMDMQEAERLVRATTRPYPGAFILHNGKKIILWAGKAFAGKQLITNALEIPLSDGYYYATDFEFEQNA